MRTAFQRDYRNFISRFALAVDQMVYGDGIQAKFIGSAVAGGTFHLHAKGKPIAEAVRDPTLYIPFSQIQWISDL